MEYFLPSAGYSCRKELFSSLAAKGQPGNARDCLRISYQDAISLNKQIQMANQLRDKVKPYN